MSSYGKLATPPSPGITDPPVRPRHKRTATGFGVKEIKAVEASVPRHLREMWRKFEAGEFKSKEEFQREFVRHVETTLARSMYNCDDV
jgi:glycogen phosphorylase